MDEYKPQNAMYMAPQGQQMPFAPNGIGQLANQGMQGMMQPWNPMRSMPMMQDPGWGNPNMQMPQGFDPNQMNMMRQQNMNSGPRGGGMPSNFNQRAVQAARQGLQQQGQNGGYGQALNRIAKQQQGPAQGLLSAPPQPNARMQSNGMQRVSPGMYRNAQGKIVRG